MTILGLNEYRLSCLDMKSREDLKLDTNRFDGSI